MPRHPDRRRQVVFAVGAAVLLAAALIGASRITADSNAPPAPTLSTGSGPVAGAADVKRLLAGIPQQGTALGKPDAPVTLVEYADLQCPYCRDWALATLPTLVREYVRAGKLRVEFRGLDFIGPDSTTALRRALAAGQQDKLWNTVELLYANQGAENSGWVSEELLAGVAASIPGLDAAQLRADEGTPGVAQAISRAAAQARAAGVRGTPSFELGPTGGTLHMLRVTSLAPGQFRDAIEAELAR